MNCFILLAHRQMLLANRFISGHEVAKILKHYEKLVGMDRWD